MREDATMGLVIAALAVVAAQDQSVRIDHAVGPVDARYRGAVTVTHRQVGAVVPGGRPSTLRCAWQADLAVARHARTAVGLATREFGRERVLAGSRAGWCGTNRAAIDAEVAARSGEIDGHLRALAAEDHAPLRADLDRLHADARAG